MTVKRRHKTSPASNDPYKLLARIIDGSTKAVLVGTAIVTGNRILIIAACGLPIIIGAAALAMGYGQRNSYR